METTTSDRSVDPLSARLPRVSSDQLDTASWLREEHLDAPVPALLEPMYAAMSRGFGRGFATWGFPLRGVDLLVIDGWLYTSIIDLDDIDELFARLDRVERLGDLADLRSTTTEWIGHLAPEFDSRRAALSAGSADALDDRGLVERFTALYQLVIELVERRFTDVPGVNLLTAAFVVDAIAAGVAASSAVAQLAGASPASAALADLVADHGAGALDEHADDAMASDVLAPTLGELARRRPDRIHARPRPSRSPVVDDALGEAFGHAAALSDELADARRAQHVREWSRLLIHSTVGGIRRLALEIGRRLVAAGVIDAADDALVLAPDELVAALGRSATGTGMRLQPIVAARRSELDTASSIDPPPIHGPVPPPMSSPTGLGPGATRVFTLASACLTLATGAGPESAPTSDRPVDRLVGTPASAGTYTGPARVVHDAGDLLDVAPGEVIVCAMTAPAWCLAISLCSALVSDIGGLCSHPAITAREFGIPAVVGTGTATTSIATGDTLTVDGDSGVVTIRR